MNKEYFDKNYFDNENAPYNEEHSFVSKVVWEEEARLILDAYKVCSTLPPQSFLDIGCGRGYVGRELKKLGVEHCEGFDISEYAIETAVMPRLRVASIQGYSYFRRFNVMSVRGTLHYLSEEEALDFFEDIEYKCKMLHLAHLPLSDDPEDIEYWRVEIDPPEVPVLFKPLDWYVNALSKRGFFLGRMTEDHENLFFYRK